MDREIDKRFITEEFLINYFPSPDRFHELTSEPPSSTLMVSKERYLAFRDGLNAERAKSGKSPLSDADLVGIIKHAEGYLQLPRILKPNKQL